MTTELPPCKPCPVCKSTEILRMERPPGKDEKNAHSLFYVKCKKCRAWTGEWVAKDAAVKAWNQRRLLSEKDYKDKQGGKK